MVIEDGSVPHARAVPGARFDEVWSTAVASEPLGLAPLAEPTAEVSTIGAAVGGSTVRIIEFSPQSRGGARSPMHRTRTIDYGIVIEGEMVLILSDSEVVLCTGDVVVQRGTDHAWENRSARPTKMAFVLIDAGFTPELTGLLGEQELTR